MSSYAHTLTHLWYCTILEFQVLTACGMHRNLNIFHQIFGNLYIWSDRGRSQEEGPRICCDGFSCLCDLLAGNVCCSSAVWLGRCCPADFCLSYLNPHTNKSVRQRGLIPWWISKITSAPSTFNHLTSIENTVFCCPFLYSSINSLFVLFLSWDL